MFDKMKGALEQIQKMQALLRDENFKALFGHPKVRELFSDKEFVQAMQSKDIAKLVGHQKFNEVLKDPEVSALMSKVDLAKLMHA